LSWKKKKKKKKNMMMMVIMMIMMMIHENGGLLYSMESSLNKIVSFYLIINSKIFLFVLCAKYENYKWLLLILSAIT
jgi:uncharacterized protein YybS (DUF2232 family)